MEICHQYLCVIVCLILSFLFQNDLQFVGLFDFALNTKHELRWFRNVFLHI